MADKQIIKERTVITVENQETGVETEVINEYIETESDDLTSVGGTVATVPVSGSPASIPVGSVSLATNPAVLYVKNLDDTVSVDIDDGTNNIATLRPGKDTKIRTEPGGSYRWKTDNASLTARALYCLYPEGSI